MNDVTAGSPPTSRNSFTGFAPQGLAPRVMSWATLVPAAICSVQAGVTIALMFGPGFDGVPPPRTRLNPPQVVGFAVAEVDPPGVVVFQPVVPGAWEPGVDLLSTPQPKPTPSPSQLRNAFAVPARGPL